MTTDTRAVSPGPPTLSSTHARRRRRVIWLTAAVVFAGIAVTAGLAARDAIASARDLRVGRAVFHRIVAGGLSSSSIRSEATTGAARFAAADARVSASRWIGGWARVPVLGAPARWLKAATAATSELAAQASGVAATLEPKLDTAHDPASRVALLDVVGAEFARLRAVVSEIDLPGAGWFLPPANAAARQLRDELARLHDALSDGMVATRGLRSFLGGPSSYLSLAANNAEMRAGGMVLQAGVLHARDGRVEAGEFRSTAELILRETVPVPKEIDALYGWLGPGREWRNTGSSPNFPVVAPVYAAMARRTDLGPVDGAVQLDLPALASLLRVVGPVEVDGRRYDAGNVERLVMHDLYVEYGAVQFERRHEFSKLAAATFAALAGRRWDPRAMIRGLGEAAAGRHLLVWSARPVEQAAWRRLGVDGSLERDGLMVTIQNHTGNKEDWFLRSTVDVSAEQIPGRGKQVTLRIRIENPTPRREPTYILGDSSLVPRGTYRAMVAVYLPGWAENVKIPATTPLLVGPDGPMRVIGTRVDVPLRGAAVVTVVFEAPLGQQGIEILPAGRHRPIRYRFEGQVLTDARPRRIAL